MKKLLYILVLSILLVECYTISSPDVAFAPASPEPGPQTGNFAVQAIPSNPTASITANPYVNQVIPEAYNKRDFIELYKINLKDYATINVLFKDDSLYLTSATPETINVKAMHQLTVNSDSSSKLLVNKDNTLLKSYSPMDLTSIASNKVKLENSGLKLVPSTLKALYSMIEAAKKEGIKGFIINSAYRSLTTQQQIFNSNLNSFKKNSKTYEEAYSKTRQLVALPGNSEHHTGLAADIFSINGRHRSDFEGTKEQVWLNENLDKYGFIIRYPKDKTKETNAVYEPWHIRYVGIPLSTYLKEKNLCLEEFFDRIFADEVLNSSRGMFMGVKSTQKVFIDSELMPNTVLEKVNSKNFLLTFMKDVNG